MDIKAGDMVVWFETGQTGIKEGQVIYITGDVATVFCTKESKTYKVKVEKLKKV